MSVIKVNKIENTGTTAGGVEIDSSGHVQVDGLQMPTTGPLSNRNLIINGAMTVSQRSTSVTGKTTLDGYVALDRYRIQLASSGTFTISQSTEAPGGFANSLKFDCTAADATPAYLVFFQMLEGQDLQQLQKGTSSAQKLTASFYVRSSKTGTYQVNIRDLDNNRIVGASYTISSADTWEYKTVTFPADTTGTLDNDNAASLQLEWWLAAGSTYTGGAVPTVWESRDNTDRAAALNVAIGAATTDDFYITGIQLEIGEKATVFEHRNFNDELARCQRYYCHYGYPFTTVTVGLRTGTGFCTSPTQAHMILTTGKGKMRANPTPDSNDVEINDAATNETISSFGDVTAYNGHVQMQINTQSGLTEGRGCNIRFTSTSGNFMLNAEL